MEASKEDRNLTDFRYACVGYSVYQDQKARTADGQEVQTELPVRVGLEVLVDIRVTSAEAAPAHARKREGINNCNEWICQHVMEFHNLAHLNQLTQLVMSFLPGKHSQNLDMKFTRNPNLVAMGVAKNLQKVGNRIKEGVDGIFYRRPK
ncbi:uncharacterized protein LOC132037093 [Lycium ferocissimum]|uniref:uncharacterized protein LOC132037093 n=1 Tax=Lycium ferocissimum TaxID=112874 RepID=UPI002815BEDC|nr:uncharacterized protein LOC132037093 [Lycium ferocissimum]